MPFKILDLEKELGEQMEDKEFFSAYSSVEKEYELIRLIMNARKEQGLPQKELAARVGLSQQAISRLEREKHIPNMDTFLRLLDGLDLELSIKPKTRQ